MPLHGIKHKLRYIDLHSNCIDSIHHLLQCTVGLHFLTNLILEKNGEDNPVCHLPGMIHLILFITVILKASLFSASTIYDLLEFVLNFAASYFWKNIITNKLLGLNYC